MQRTPTSPPSYEQYEARIRACFRCWPGASQFYQTLIDYLHTATTSTGFSPLQVPITYSLGNGLGENDQIEAEHGNQPPLRRPPSPRPVATPAAGPERTRLGQQSHITVAEGFLAPETIGILGEMYHTRPEFFIDHLAPGICPYGSDMSTRMGRYELPNLPSKRENIIHVRFMSMLRMPSKGGWAAQAAEKAAHAAHAFSSSLASRFERRKLLENKHCSYDQRLFNNRHYGATRFRALHLHKDQWLTVEQMVSFSVKREGDKIWHGLFLLDGGRRCGGIDLPWAEYVGDGADDHGTSFVPIIPYNLPVLNERAPALEANTKDHSPYHPGLDIISAATSSGAEAQLLAEDPFYILSCVYHAAARTRIQLLSFIESDIAECSSTTTGGSPRIQALEQLRFNLQLLRRVEQFCKEDLANITRSGSAAWPRTERLAEIDQIRDRLQGDYGYLVEQCNRLALQCEAASSTLVGLAQWMEAREGFRESRNVANLTTLAIVFIPLNYISSCLSMNVTGITGGVPMWIWAVASGISVLVTGILVRVFTRWKRL
ncbi:hypothetical protein B0H67DRAFT_478187 [Lasiosphaeris hirsuta]|uniref:Uncharacterized protein n=1 Tax=Lasiosphaeris hirsuta TaxID=260670 RepID=A0AA40EAJ7_9PEZI|nr:hypothetical protein B0H67DRAFT_478187 [Lasiosphaeris hirsuta]